MGSTAIDPAPVTSRISVTRHMAVYVSEITSSIK